MRGISCQFFIYITKNTPSARVRYPFGGEKKNREIRVIIGSETDSNSNIKYYKHTNYFITDNWSVLFVPKSIFNDMQVH